MGKKVIAEPLNDTNIFEIWKEYERVAMHFNELLIQLRMRAIGGLAAITTLTGFISKESETQTFNWEIILVITCILIMFWIAIAVLDLGYYNRLLNGAIDALLELEKKGNFPSKNFKINLSTNISKRFSEKEKTDFRSKNIWSSIKNKLFDTRYLFYLIVLLTLIIVAIISYFKCLA
mgnify:CR=1 FL=1